MAEFTAELDFQEDWTRIMRASLVSFGVHIDEAATNDDVSDLYFNFLHRQLEPRPRQLRRSRELHCPPSLEPALRRLSDRMRRGDDLIPYLSKTVDDPTRNDHLLSDWGIHHFHLGLDRDRRNPKFVRRTGPLLFARVTRDEVFLLDIAKHGDWAQIRFVEIMHLNWPEAIRSRRLNGVNGVEPKLTDEDVRVLRRKHANTVLEMGDGTVYGPVGGGMMSNGLSLEVRLASDYHYFAVQGLESAIHDNLQEIVAKLSAKGLEPISPLRFNLRLDADQAFAVEAATGAAVALGPFPPKREIS